MDPGNCFGIFISLSFRLVAPRNIEITMKYLFKGMNCVILVLIAFGSYGTIKDEMSPAFDKALYNILDLKTVTAQRMLDLETTKLSGTFNLYLEYLNNWNSVIETVVYEDQERYQKYMETLNVRLAGIDERADKSSPSYHILLAEIYGQAGLVNILFGDYFSGFLKIMKANKNVQLNIEKHPGYWRNHKLSGVLNVVLDQMSTLLKVVARVFNLRGDPLTGFEQLGQYLKDVADYPGLKMEALLYYSFALKVAKADERAYVLFKEHLVPDQSPVLALFLQANIMYFTGRNEEAMKMMTKYSDAVFEVPFVFKDYLYSKVKFNRLDSDTDIYLKRFLQNTKLKNYKREITNMLSLHYFMQGNITEYYHYKQMIEACPKAAAERDREADADQRRPYLPHLNLLKARYLVMGGYYMEVQNILTTINPDEFNQKAYLTEYDLIYAKVKYNTNLLPEALQFCEKAIANGKDCDEHYAAEAALLAGDISLKAGDRMEAARYFQMALMIKGQNDIFIELIEKKANNRLKGI